MGPGPVYPRADRLRAIVWKRQDYRESSRLITLLTAEQGRLVTIAKGAHRSNSPCLGRIDFLNRVEVKISSGQLPVLHRVRLVHEPRGLREPRRFAAASYVAELFDPVLLPGREDAGLFELLSGGLTLIERCPAAGLGGVLLGIEWRLLGELGLRAGLDLCIRCGEPVGDRAYPAPDLPGVVCAAHAAPGKSALPHPALEWLRELDRSSGRRWPTMPAPPPAAIALLGEWSASTAERRARLRQWAFAPAF